MSEKDSNIQKISAFLDKNEKDMIYIYTRCIRSVQIKAYIDKNTEPRIVSHQVVIEKKSKCASPGCIFEKIDCRAMQQAVIDYERKDIYDYNYILEFVDNSKGTGAEKLFDCQIKMNIIE
jgi:hypothetical protein